MSDRLKTKRKSEEASCSCRWQQQVRRRKRHLCSQILITSIMYELPHALTSLSMFKVGWTGVSRRLGPWGLLKFGVFNSLCSIELLFYFYILLFFIFVLKEYKSAVIELQSLISRYKFEVQRRETVEATCSSLRIGTTVPHLEFDVPVISLLYCNDSWWLKSIIFDLYKWFIGGYHFIQK